MKVGRTSDEPSSQRWQCCHLQCCNNDGATAHNVTIAVAAMVLRCAAVLQQLCSDGAALRGAAIVAVQRWRCCNSCAVMARSCDVVVARRCCDNGAMTLLLQRWRCG